MHNPIEVAMKRRSFLTATAATAAFLPKLANAQDLSPAQPRDWSGNTPLRYPDPDLVALELKLLKYTSLR